jgi:hypothetical protein
LVFDILNILWIILPSFFEEALIPFDGGLFAPSAGFLLGALEDNEGSNI